MARDCDRAAAERQLRHLQTSRDKLHTALDQCLSVLHDGQQQYLAATDNSRRDLNQAVFDKIYLDDDEITNSQHKAVYHYLLDSNLPAVLEGEAKRPQDTTTPDKTKNLRPMAGGSNVTLLVELRGFEPLTSSMPWKRATNCAIAPCGLHRCYSSGPLPANRRRALRCGSPQELIAHEIPDGEGECGGWPPLRAASPRPSRRDCRR